MAVFLPTVKQLRYLTSFAATENPLVESAGGGQWLNGAADGRDWTNYRATSGLGAYGTQGSGGAPPYDDSVCLRQPPTGRVWGPDIDVRGTVFIRNRGSWTGNHEVELLVRGSVATGVAKFYEIIFSVTTNAYIEIMQWLGPLGTNSGGASGNPLSFSSKAFANDGATLNDGDRVRVTVISNVIRLYRQQGSATDWTEYSISYDIGAEATTPKYLEGMPGMGWYRNGTCSNDDYGFSAWSAVAA